jgi:hypothetical protein
MALGSKKERAPRAADISERIHVPDTCKTILLNNG